MRELSLRIFALMQQTVTLEEAVALWRISCTVFLSESLTDRVREAVDEVNKAVSSASQEEINTVDDSLLCDGSKYRHHIKYTLSRQLRLLISVYINSWLCC